MKIVFDFDLWNLRDYESFVNTQQNNDIDEQTRLVVKAIKSWDIDKEITVENFEDLPFSLYSGIVTTLSDQIEAMMNDKSGLIAGFDISNWKIKTFNRYNKALLSNDFDAVLQFMKDAGINCEADGSTVGVETFFGWVKSFAKAIELHQKK